MNAIYFLGSYRIYPRRHHRGLTGKGVEEMLK